MCILFITIGLFTLSYIYFKKQRRLKNQIQFQCCDIPIIVIETPAPTPENNNNDDNIEFKKEYIQDNDFRIL